MKTITIAASFEVAFELIKSLTPPLLGSAYQVCANPFRPLEKTIYVAKYPEMGM